MTKKTRKEVVKRTLRQFTFAVPDGTEMRMIRTYVRAVDGTDYPHDQEIEVQKFKSVVVEYSCSPDTERTCENTTEEWALAQQPAGSVAKACRDFVTLVEKKVSEEEEGA